MFSKINHVAIVTGNYAKSAILRGCFGMKIGSSATIAGVKPISASNGFTARIHPQAQTQANPFHTYPQTPP